MDPVTVGAVFCWDGLVLARGEWAGASFDADLAFVNLVFSILGW